MSIGRLLDRSFCGSGGVGCVVLCRRFWCEDGLACRRVERVSRFWRRLEGFGLLELVGLVLLTRC